MSQDYTPTIGIECHVQLKTKTKLFAAVGNDAREAPPNSLISHICLGMPGALPVLNKHAVELACRAGFALKSTPQKFSKFDRKHYFYPDLPMGYQISQFHNPIILGGEVDIVIDGAKKKIGITRAHLESDAGKNTHPNGKDHSLVDLNRAGTPLLEIVSEPDMHSAEEARAYVSELYLLMKYADVTEGDLYHGNMRFDVNISISKDPKKLGNRSEIKNLNSFKAVEKAVQYEIKRQSEMLNKGEAPKQETRGWDDAKQKTTTQRSKEESHDYRYFPDPDIPPVVLDDKFINSISGEMPELPDDLRKKLKDFDFDSRVVEEVLLNPDILEEVLEVIKQGNKDDVRNIAFWGLQSKQSSEEAVDLGELSPRVKMLTTISGMQNSGKLSSTSAKEAAFKLRLGSSIDEVQKFVDDKQQVSDEGEIESIVEEVIAANSQAADDVKSGEMKAIGFLVGQVMKASQGKANPGLAQKIIKDKLGIG